MNEYLKLPTLALRASVFKYMVLNVLGGIFSDVDTVPLKPLKDWVKPDWVCHNVKLIAGLEFDIPTKYDNIWPEIYEYPLQLCSWTLASVPNHEILTSIITQIFDIIKKSTPEEIELMDGSKLAGPERLSRVIFSNWEKSGFSLEDFRNFGLEPKCFSNNLFLPIDYFNSALEGTKLFRSEAYIQYSGPRRSYDLSKKINEIM
jgi:alpha 1,6-mannosyltransferase